MGRAIAVAVGVALVPFVLPPSAAAFGGYELTSPGARPNGRGGANFVGADSPLTLFYNPANLARLDGYHLVGATHLHFTERCMQRVEVVETDGARQRGEVFPNVCSEGRNPDFMPQVAFSARLADDLTLGLGVYTPPVGFQEVRYGDSETVTFGDEFTPTRYLLIENDLIQVFPTVGLAYAPHPQVRVGAAFGWGITHAIFANAAFSSVEVMGIEATSDARNELEATDAFVPRVQLGAWAQPVRQIPFELGLGFRWTGDVKSDDAELNIRAFNAEPLDVEAETTLNGVGFEVPQTAELTFGLRYFEPLEQPADDIGDRLSTEKFDVEANLMVIFAERVDSFVVDLPDDETLTVDPGVEGIPPVDVALPDDIAIEHRWHTRLGLHVGGDYNPIPGVLGLRAGLSFNSDGVDDGFENIDFTPFRRVGLHAGATVRIASVVDLSVAYAHIFQPDRDVGVDEAGVRRVVGGDEPTDPADAEVVNAGTITSDYDLLMVEASGHF
ncbi:MAG: OmpP1/FadL family transporter [Myxococcota bacterium]